jgi:very-short-patch-repair endonuclease/DNA polymerase III delta prime subunit
MELVADDGWLGYQEQRVRHPLLSQGLNLDFDVGGPEFRVSLALEQPELFTALLRQIPSVEARVIGQMADDLKKMPVQPLGGESTNQYLKRLAQGLFRDGEFKPDGRPSNEMDGPVIWRETILHVRKKVAGLSKSLSAILEHLQLPSVVPAAGMCRIVGVDPNEGDGFTGESLGGSGSSASAPQPAADESEILFSKLANAEQYRIAAQLEHNNSVLVQGPPGTGKTHTIANLLGHLLAQGKTVLVTAHTTKALRVLRDKVVEPLQPLCLSVLDSESESKAQLAKAAQQIVARLATCDAGEMKKEAGSLRKKRADMLKTVHNKRGKLRSARESEIEEIVLSGETIRPVDAAKQIALNAATHGWIPEPVNHDYCPLSDRDIIELYATNSTISPDDEIELRAEQPDSNQIVTPADFRLLAGQRDDAGLQGKKHRPQFWDARKVSQCSAAKLRTIHASLQQAASALGDESHWRREVLFCGWAGGPSAEAWVDLVVEIEALGKDAAEVQRLVMERGPVPSSQCNSSVTAAHYGEIIDHLKSGGRLSFLTKITKRHWQVTIIHSRVDGQAPRTLEDFICLKRKVDLDLRLARFEARWKRSVEANQGPAYAELGQNPERTALNFAREIRQQIAWRNEVWNPLLDALVTAGFLWPKWLETFPIQPGEHGDLHRTKLACSREQAEIVEAQAARLLEKELAAKLASQGAYLARYPVSEIAQVLLKSQRTWSADDYEVAYIELRRLEGLRSAYERRSELLKRLEETAPAWCAVLIGRIGIHGLGTVPGDISAAWKWRRLKQELDARAASSVTGIEGEIRVLEEQIHAVTGEIIEKDTWAAQRIRTRLPQQQALIGYVQTIGKITKTGRGVRDAELLRAAQKQLELAREAVPVWIMPLNRVYASFDPLKVKFDVVIIDEASQSDVTALAALYLGNEQVVVGDKEQVTPDAVGQVLSEVSRLIETHLRGIPNSGLYDGQTSIYDLAETAFGGVVALREHFRCVPEIIQFSNHLSYGGAILPLREPTSANISPALVPYRIQGTRSLDSKTNEAEVDAIVSLMIACIRHPKFSVNENAGPATFAAISLLGSEQSQLIEAKLRMYLTPEELVKHDVLCGIAANLQGDERDVVFLSMVDSPPEDGLLTTRGAGARDIYKKRYNVAVSRARNQLWVVHSVDPDLHLNAADLRRRLIEHARDPEALMGLMEQKAKRTESEFERLVVCRLVSAGFKVTTQWRVGSYRIDLVVEGLHRKLAVECDGERWHTADELENDMRRQAILERLGWVFARIRGSVFFRNPDAGMAEVYAKLEELGIEPLANDGGSEEPRGGPLVEEIKRAAEAIRVSWKHPEVSNFDASVEAVQQTFAASHPLALGAAKADRPAQTELPYGTLPAQSVMGGGGDITAIENCIIALLEKPKRLETDAVILSTIRDLGLGDNGRHAVETALGCLLLRRRITRGATHIGIVETY